MSQQALFAQFVDKLTKLNPEARAVLKSRGDQLDLTQVKKMYAMVTDAEKKAPPKEKKPVKPRFVKRATLHHGVYNEVKQRSFLLHDYAKLLENTVMFMKEDEIQAFIETNYQKTFEIATENAQLTGVMHFNAVYQRALVLVYIEKHLQLKRPEWRAVLDELQVPYHVAEELRGLYDIVQHYPLLRLLDCDPYEVGRYASELMNDFVKQDITVHKRLMGRGSGNHAFKHLQIKFRQQEEAVLGRLQESCITTSDTDIISLENNVKNITDNRKRMYRMPTEAEPTEADLCLDEDIVMEESTNQFSEANEEKSDGDESYVSLASDGDSLPDTVNQLLPQETVDAFSKLAMQERSKQMRVKRSKKNQA